MYDLIIIGSGPAGLSAALYAKRAMLNVAVVEQMPLSGGQIINTEDVDNYIGLSGVGGFELAQKFRTHVDSYNTEFITAGVSSVKDNGEHKTITLSNGQTIDTKTIIVATGAKNRKLGVSGEAELTGKGVAYCATCDGMFYRGKTVAVVGGGDVAVEDAIYLSRICGKVYVIHRRDELRAAKILSDKLRKIENVEILWNTTVEKINGQTRLESTDIKNKLDNSMSQLKLDGLFVAVGTEPNSEFVRDIVATDNSGYIIADESGKTSIPGIFAAGDVRTKELRQVITAASDGANCVNSVEQYLVENN